MKPSLLMLLFLAISLSACQGDRAADQAPTPEEQQAEMQEWFQDARFGMFIHWGVYSVLGDGEWVMNQKKMTVEEYEKLPPQFNPSEFDAAQWVRTAKDAGMKYITITSKHHDGFAMWDSEVSDYDIVDRTPYGKDPLKMLADECEKQGLKLFFYHSHLDWHHPDYYPRGRTGHASARPDSGNFDRYLDYMNAQIAELASGEYGQIGGFWFDGWWDQQDQSEGADPQATLVDWRLQETYDLIHRLQPQALIGNNHHVAPFPGENFQMFEKDLPGHNTTGFSEDSEVSALPLETCETINTSWGYNQGDQNFKSTTELIHYLVRSAGYNANFLLNVGPTPQGTLQPEFVERLSEMGRWMDRSGASIYGTRGGPMPPQEWGVATHRRDSVFVHVLQPDAPETLVLPGTSSLKVKRASVMGTENNLAFTQEEDLSVTLPAPLRDAVDTIILLELDN